MPVRPRSILTELPACFVPHVRVQTLIAEYAIDAHVLVAERVLAFHFCIWRYPSTLSPLGFARSIARQLSASVPSYAELLLSQFSTAGSALSYLRGTDARAALVHGILKPLSQSKPPPGSDPTGRCCILIDSLDESVLHEPSHRLDVTSIAELLAAREKRKDATRRSSQQASGGSAHSQMASLCDDITPGQGTD